MFGKLAWGACVGGRVEVWTNNILYGGIEGQIHFSTACQAKMSLPHVFFSVHSSSSTLWSGVGNSKSFGTAISLCSYFVLYCSPVSVSVLWTSFLKSVYIFLNRWDGHWSVNWALAALPEIPHQCQHDFKLSYYHTHYMIKSFEPPEALYTDYSVRGGFWA